jgi:type IV pilus assembly protein PilA
MLHSKLLKNNSGFTLVELMVAVGITGALTTIAVPNYLKYVAKSRESEAKIGLSAIYVGEKQFGVEYGFYTACLPNIGYQGSNVPNERYYVVGFNNTPASATSCGTSGNTACYDIPASAACATVHAANNYTYYEATAKASGAAVATQSDLLPASGGGALTGVGKIRFSVGAAGRISNSGNLDIWKIDENKVLSNISSGI